ncbi:hypothetical protein VPH35_029880 [Triticum aestivum]|uniref:Uncharacterized protein n=1 Tax=Triticum turgidum subsp. durum TaxID=4567 RepID=A0A9R1RP32_TRITD|nr:unnamed protein product [Triticum turgidum subsp. durum]
MQLEMENAMIEALQTPLAFEDGGLSPPHQPPAVQDMDSPEMIPCLLPCITSPTVATAGFQLSAVTKRVGTIQISEGGGSELFAHVPPPIISPARPRPSAPPKSRATSAPSRRSARQGAAANPMPVAQRAVLRLVQELGALGPKDMMTPKVATVLMKRF